MTLQEKQILKKTDNISIRIDSELSRKLHEQCSDQKISLNTLVNHLLDKQVNWHGLATEMGWITMFRSTFRELSDSVSEEKIKKIAETTGHSDLKNANDILEHRYVNREITKQEYKRKFWLLRQKKDSNDNAFTISSSSGNIKGSPPDIQILANPITSIWSANLLTSGTVN